MWTNTGNNVNLPKVTNSGSSTAESTEMKGGFPGPKISQKKIVGGCGGSFKEVEKPALDKNKARIV